jgi:hypothetical protein
LCKDCYVGPVEYRLNSNNDPYLEHHIPSFIEIYAYVTTLKDNVDAIKRSIETSIGISKEVGIAVNAEKTMYMLLSRHQTARQNHDIKTTDRSFENWHS